MSQQISVELRLVDNLTKNMEAVQRQLSAHLGKIEGSALKTGSSLNVAEKSVTRVTGAEQAMEVASRRLAANMAQTQMASDRLGREFQELQGAGGGLNTTLKTLEAASASLAQKFNGINPPVEKSSRALQQHTSVIGQVRTAYYALAAVAGGVVVKGIFDAALQGERFRRTMEFAEGSAAAGARTYQMVRGEVQRLGLNLSQAAGDYSKLAAAANGTELQGKASADIFIAVSEAATVLGLKADQTSGALMAIQQMMSKGNVQAEELRGQLGERLPGAFNMAARAMGVSTQELSKMLERGEVVASEFLPKFARELHRTYGGAAVSASQQGQAAINRFNTSIFEANQQLGETLLPGLTKALKEMTSSIDKAVANGGFRKLGEQVGFAAQTGRDLFLVFAGAKIISIASNFDKAAFAATGFGKALTFLKAHPVFIAIAGFGVVVDMVTNKMDAAAGKMGDVAWMKDANRVVKAKETLDVYYHRLQQINDLQKKRATEPMSETFTGVDYGRLIKEKESEIKDLEKGFKDVTGRGFQEYEKTFGKGFLESQLGALQKIKVAREALTKDPTFKKPEMGETKTIKVDALLDSLNAGESKAIEVIARMEKGIDDVQTEFAQNSIEKLYAYSEEKQKIAEKEKQRAKEVAEAEKAAGLVRMDVQSQIVGTVGAAMVAIAGKSKAAFAIAQAFAAAEVIFNTARAITQAMAMPFGTGLPLIPFYKGLAAAQLGLIAAQTIKGFEKGTTFAPGGMALVGERGPELINLPRGSQVFNNSQTNRMLAAPSSPTINAGLVVHIAGNPDQASLNRLEEISQRHVDHVVRALAMANDQVHPELRRIFH